MLNSGRQQPSMLISPSVNSTIINPQCGMMNMSSGAIQSPPIDEKSVKDIIQILNKCIDKTKNLVEFSQIAQVENIGNYT